LNRHPLSRDYNVEFLGRRSSHAVDPFSRPFRNRLRRLEPAVCAGQSGNRKIHESMRRQAVRVFPCVAHDSGGLGRGQGSNRLFQGADAAAEGRRVRQGPAKIYAVVRYNRNKQPISDFMPDNIADWKSRAKDGKTTTLDDLPRGGKPAFVPTG
jgi:hypothetical protein